MGDVDLLVVGAGPAGLGAAITARRLGVNVLVVDDQDRPGGQLFKQIHKFFGSKEHMAGRRGFSIGLDLLAEAESLGVTIRLNTKVLGVLENRVIWMMERDGKTVLLQPKRILLATGGMEKAISFPGWTLPGVITAGAAQTMCNIERVLPGRKILMVGTGNVGLIVGYQLLQAGAEVVALVEGADRISGYSVHAGKLRRAGVPVFTGYTVKQAAGTVGVEAAEIIALDNDWNQVAGTEITFDVDTVCLAVGLSPNTLLARMHGCSVVYKPDLGGFLPDHDENMESSIHGVYVAGDLAGIEEASTALDEGRLAGTSVAVSLKMIGNSEAESMKRSIRGRLDNLRKSSSRREEPGFNGVYSLQRMKQVPGYPAEERIKKGAVVVIECAQEIPCDPCVSSCPFGAITLGPDITRLPVLAEDECKGCGMCIAGCPGQAIFMIDYNLAEGKASVAFPYEFLPLPRVGDRVTGTDKSGKAVAEVEILKVDNRKSNDRTPVITVSVDREFIHQVRSIRMEEG